MPHPCPSSVTRECHGRASSPRRGARDQNLPLPRYRGAIAGYKWAFGVAGDETFCPLQRHSDKSRGGCVTRLPEDPGVTRNLAGSYGSLLVPRAGELHTAAGLASGFLNFISNPKKGALHE